MFHFCRAAFLHSADAKKRLRPFALPGLKAAPDRCHHRNQLLVPTPAWERPVREATLHVSITRPAHLDVAAVVTSRQEGPA